MNTTDQKYTALHYHTYLDLDKILDAQHPQSAALGAPAHDETLFIIMHQVYELWFKQMIHELDSVMQMFEDDLVDEHEISSAVHRLGRITEIQQLLIRQIRVMETMTPMEFLDFRNYLFPASGFQSFQFRMLETMLGLPRQQRVMYNNEPFDAGFNPTQLEQLTRTEQQRSLFQLVEAWLERTPFLQVGDFRFIDAYKEAVERMLHEETSAIEAAGVLSEEVRQMRLKMVDETRTYFASVLDAQEYEKLREAGKVKLSYSAMIAALLINLYREEPILQMPYRLLSRVMDVEEFFTMWRQRHAQMVLRMIGRKAGTGGSSGHDYLNRTAQQHHIFADLFNLSTLLIPKSELPPLPPTLKRKLGFYYSTDDRSS